MEKATEHYKYCIQNGGRIFQELRSADDQAMLANCNTGLQRTLDSLHFTSRDWNEVQQKDETEEDQQKGNEQDHSTSLYGCRL